MEGSVTKQAHAPAAIGTDLLEVAGVVWAGLVTTASRGHGLGQLWGGSVGIHGRKHLYG